MKTLVTGYCALFLFVLPGFAQRVADLNVSVAAPEGPVTVTPQQPVSIDILIDNLGPDTIEMADTLAYYMLIDTDTVPSGIPNQNHLNYTQNFVGSGDSVIITRLISFDESFAGYTVELCIFIKPKNANDPIADPDLDNNTGCVLITVQEEDVTGIDDQTAGAVTIAPNPASGQFTIASQLPVSTIHATDASGKVLSVEMTDTQTINCSSWAPGTYFLTVETNDGTVVKRVVVR